MIIDFQAQKLEKALEPRFDVGFLSFHEMQQLVTLLGRPTPVANGTGVNVPTAPTKDIKPDRVIFDKQKMEYFRYLALSIIERLAKDDPTAWAAPDGTSKLGSDYLRPIFSQTLQRGTTMWTMLREMQQTSFPIPADYLVFLPAPDSGFRDDVVRALVPFEKAQREALTASWNDETVALRITHTKPTGLILH